MADDHDWPLALYTTIEDVTEQKMGVRMDGKGSFPCREW